MTKSTKILVAFALILSLSLAATDSHAQDNSFTGFTSSDWNVATNWSNGTTPNGESVRVGEFIWASPVTAEITSLTNPTVQDLRVGADDLGEGTLNHSAGSLTANGWAFVGVDGGVGTYNLSGTASFDVNFAENGGQQEFHVGLGGASTSTGTLNISDSASLSFPRGYIGSNSQSTGIVNQTGGSVEVDQWMSIARQSGAQGTYNMSGGSLAVVGGPGVADGITVGENDADTKGEFNVSGSSMISTPKLHVGRFDSDFAVPPNPTPGAEGSFNVTGGDASINVTSFLAVGWDKDKGRASDTTGTLSFTSDASGVSPITVGIPTHVDGTEAEVIFLNDGSGVGSANLVVDLETVPVASANVLLLDLVTTPGVDMTDPLNPIGYGEIIGTFAGLPEGSVVPGSGGRTITYAGGDGNDIWLMGMSTGVDGDFDNNGVYECSDVDGLVAEIVAGTNNASFDLNNDTMVDGADLTAWLAEAGSTGGLTASGNPVLLGDANLDGSVDGQDFVVWNANKFTNVPAWCSGDFNADGAVNGQDFVIWNANKFNTADGVAAVPEPAGLMLVLCGCLVFFRRR
jgi:hypothetical protein